MNYIIISVASIIFLALLVTVNVSFNKQYNNVLIEFPKLFQFRKWLFVIPILIAIIVDVILLIKGYGLLHINGIGIYQKDQIKTSAELTMVSMYFLLLLASIGFTISFAYGKPTNNKKMLIINGIIFTCLTILGIYMAWTLDYSLFNGVTATIVG